MINMIDKSGELRPVKEFQDTLRAVNEAIIKFDINSPLTIHLTVIRDALIELIAIREFIANHSAQPAGVADPLPQGGKDDQEGKAGG